MVNIEHSEAAAATPIIYESDRICQINTQNSGTGQSSNNDNILGQLNDFFTLFIALHIWFV